ncbi:Retrovirus-related Pol polyprotein from transposon TNT 1-94 [Vitis vinifera]|uniref:Retrovirus-related Pol polyprotein from transposon TNT 1-94 n=1 Tax=Vitis vinifera TaxID=29760 RepID=A0A438DFM3_VITVI|nr:Retrovirus-related Pol polyprotein from transposon TNT 1-94 [Vitis vinifera]
MEDLLYVKDYYLPVFASERPENKTDAEWNLLHRQVCGYIRQWVDDNVLNHVSEEKHARSLWNKLEQLYARKTGNNKLFLIKKMMSLKYQDGTPMTDHLNTFQGIINQLAGMNIKFEEEVQGLWLLGTLPDSWETFRTSLSNSAPDGIMNMDLVKSCVLNEEMRRKSQGSSSQSSVLVIEKRGRSKSRGPKNRDRSKSKTNKFANVECHYCHLKGHIRKYCRQLKRDMKQGKVKEKKNDNGGEDDQVATTTSDFLIVYDNDVVNFACQETSWVIDSGASIHATPRKDFFTSYTSGDFGSVRMGNDGSAKSIGIGDVRLETSNGTMLTLKNVKHISDIRMNLISTGKLDDEGFCNTFRDSQWKLTRGSMVIAKGNKSSSLYLMQARVIDSSINAVDDDSTFELWHNRLGHMSEKGLMILAKKNLLSGMKKGSLKRCAHCLAGKQTRVAFKTLRHTRKPGMLDLVYSDFHALVERQSGEKLKCIRTDNGGEYSGPFDEYCRQHGIRHQKTPHKTPQLNGLAERINRTLVERVRCLLSQSQLPRSFWGEALNTVVHVLNLTPCVPLEFDVPDRIWSNNEISYDHLRVFGCKAFVHIPKDERSKLDAKTRPCVFIGYGQDELGYRFYDPVQKKLVRSRDVVFMEDHTIQDIEKTKPMESQHSSDLIDLDPVPLANLPTQVEDEAHDDQHDMGDVETPTQVEDEVHDDQHDMGDVEIPIQVEVDDDVHEQSPAAEAPSDIPLRRSTRDRHPSTWYSVDDYVLLTDGGEPESYVEAMEDENKMKWVDAMQDEMESLHENHSFELVKLPKGKKSFEEQMSSIRVVLGLAASLDLEIQQMDVKTAFLHAEESLYGLKQAPRQWYKKFESVMGEQGYRKTTSDHCVFVQKFSDDDFVILLLYVDDILIVGRNVSRIDNLKKQLSKSFAMKDLGPVKRILGIRIERDRASKKLCMLQEQYIERMLVRFNMGKAKVVSSPLASHFKLSSRHSPSTDKEKEDMRRVPYASAVGSLMYAMVCTRPDIAYAVGVVSRFLSNPGRHHWEAVKWIMRYLRGTSKLKLTFGSGKPIFVGYTDSDMTGDVDNRRSTSGYLMTFSGGAVSWQSRLQKCVALSTTEAEYIAAAEACKELLWMKCFMQELGFKQQRYVVYCDNQSAIHLSKNSTYHARSKHIDVRYHSMRDALNDNLFEIEKIHTDNNGSDMLTKTLPREKLGVCCSIAGMISSNGRFRFVCDPIDLKFEGEIFNSLISNLNGEDRIWSS